MDKIFIRGAVSALSLTFITSNAAAVGVGDYMVITEAAGSFGDAFSMSNSEIGAIGINDKTSPPGSLPALPPVPPARTVSPGITFDGDAAITNGGRVMIMPDPKITASNSDVHAVNTGAASPGSQGIDCSSSFDICTISGDNISGGNQFNTSSPASFSPLGNGNGVQGNINLLGVTGELAFLRDLIPMLDTTDTGAPGLATLGTIDIASGLIANANGVDNPNAVCDFSGDSFSGLNIIDIDTNGNDFSIVNSNLTIKGDAGDTIIFRVAPTWIMNVSQSNLLLDGGIGDNNVLWYVDADEGETSFSYDNVTFQGMALWDIDAGDTTNVIRFNNVQFCGQVVTDAVDFQNVSGSECAFDTSAVPVPAAVWLFGSGLIGLAGIARRKKAA
jgi:hypothetical protein